MYIASVEFVSIYTKIMWVVITNTTIKKKTQHRMTKWAVFNPCVDYTGWLIGFPILGCDNLQYIR